MSDNATGVATLYNVNPATNLPSITPLVITIPDDGTVTGQVFSNTAGNFNGDAFLFVSEDGTISGWRGRFGDDGRTVCGLPSTANVYKGTALATIGANSYLLAANFLTGKIDVLKGNGGVSPTSLAISQPAELLRFFTFSTFRTWVARFMSPMPFKMPPSTTTWLGQAMASSPYLI